jgi:hypothetical protein
MLKKRQLPQLNPEEQERNRITDDFLGGLERKLDLKKLKVCPVSAPEKNRYDHHSNIGDEKRKIELESSDIGKGVISRSSLSFI